MKKKHYFIYVPILVISIVLLFVFLQNSKDKLSLTYTMTLSPDETSRPLINLEVTYKTKSTKKVPKRLPLIAPMQDYYMNIDEIEVIGGTLEIEKQNQEKLRNLWETTTYHINHASNSFSVSYRPKIGVKEGNSHTGYSGLKFGYADRKIGFASGYNLFLFPKSNQESIDDIRVKIINKTGNRILVNWPKKGEYYYPQLNSGYKLESLLRSSIVWGDFDITNILIQDHNYDVYISSILNQEIKTNILKKLEKLLTNLQATFGSPIFDKTALYFFPKTPDGYDLYSPNWADNYITSFFPPTNKRWKKLASNLLKNYMQLELF